MIENNLIFEKEEGNSSGGRKPILLILNPTGAYVIGLKLAADHVTGALTNMEANVIIKQTILLEGRSLDNVLSCIVDIVTDLLKEGKVQKNKLLGVGLGMAGIINSENGQLKYTSIFDWHDVNIVELLTKRLKVPIYVDNDVNTLALTENWFGAGRGMDNFLLVTVGRGVGMGIVINGQIYRGSFGGAGEFGHTVIEINGPLCDCGKHGCLESIASDPAIMKRAAEEILQGKLQKNIKDINDLISLGNNGNAVVQKIFAKAGEALGVGIANLVNIFNPQLVIISGEGVRAGELLMNPMKIAIKKNVFNGLFELTEIVIDPLDDDAWARGSASLVLQKLFESPIHQ
ncbi:MAG: ROK family protein [Pelolinea sp.]|nr:ROK family protein [Pelolinea sp.]